MKPHKTTPPKHDPIGLVKKLAVAAYLDVAETLQAAAEQAEASGGQSGFPELCAGKRIVEIGPTKLYVHVFLGTPENIDYLSDQVAKIPPRQIDLVPEGGLPE